MKVKILAAVLFILIFSGYAHAQSGDIAFWFSDASPSSQVKLNSEYFSIKLYAAYIYYKSGFFENITNIAIASETTITDGAQSVQSTMVNKVWQKLDDNGDFVSINDHLVALSPATATNVKIKVSYNGIGEARWKFIFDALADSKFKTALTFSPHAAAIVTAVSPVVEKLLASPYDTKNPRQILDSNQSYTLYSDISKLQSDSLREGYLVIVSSREGHNDDLSKIQNLSSGELRFNATKTGLEYKDGNGWKPLSKCSYVILSITKTPIRGENQKAGWYEKYRAAKDISDKVKTDGIAPDKVRDQALTLWHEGNALLYADLNYIDSEREQIKNTHFADLQACLAPKPPANTKWPWNMKALDIKNLGVAVNYLEISHDYKNAVKNLPTKFAYSQDEGRFIEK